MNRIIKFFVSFTATYKTYNMTSNVFLIKRVQSSWTRLSNRITHLWINTFVIKYLIGLQHLDLMTGAKYLVQIAIHPEIQELTVRSIWNVFFYLFIFDPVTQEEYYIRRTWCDLVGTSARIWGVIPVSVRLLCFTY